MLYFESDYTEGADERILQKLIETNREALSGYGVDRYSDSAREKIKKACECPEADVHLIAGGTQTNLVVIDALLDSYEGVISAATGHVNWHEAGAIENTGHKVLTVPSHDGKIDPEELEHFIKTFYADGNYEHMVFPGAVYISHPTEYGTLYTKAELEKIHQICKTHEISLFLDGARLAYGLMAKDSDVTLPVLAKTCDVFYIGGTKCGALLGEAVVFPQGAPKHFFTRMKQHGAVLAKGRVLGIQFDALFTDGLYQEIGAHAIKMTELLKSILQEKNLQFYLESPTNQQFVVMENSRYNELLKNIKLGFIDVVDDNHTIVRFCVSWATREEDVLKLRELL